MDQAELGMQEVVVQTKAFAASGHDAGSVLGIGNLETGTAFQFRENTNQPLGDPVALRNAGGLLVLTGLMGEIFVGATLLGGNTLGVLNQVIRVGLNEASEMACSDHDWG